MSFYFFSVHWLIYGSICILLAGSIWWTFLELSPESCLPFWRIWLLLFDLATGRIAEVRGHPLALVEDYPVLWVTDLMKISALFYHHCIFGAPLSLCTLWTLIMFLWLFIYFRFICAALFIYLFTLRYFWIISAVLACNLVLIFIYFQRWITIIIFLYPIHFLFSSRNGCVLLFGG